MSTTTTKSATDGITCNGCWQSPPLRPSGLSFTRHRAGDGSFCTGTPIFPVQGGDTAVKTEKHSCPECGATSTKLLKSGKLPKHEGADGTCEQRPDVKAVCPTCSRRISLQRGKFMLHKDIAKGERCTGSNRETHHKPYEAFPNARKTVPAQRSTEPKPKREPLPQGIDAAIRKATLFGSAIAQHGWKTDVKTSGLEAEAIATRGKETIVIVWEESRCIGGTIFHTYEGRKIALRNKNAAVMRASMTPEAIHAEHARVKARGSRTVVKGNVRGKNRNTEPRSAQDMKALRSQLPFDPRIADEKEIASAIVGRKLTWTNETSGLDESGTVNKNQRAIRLGQGRDGSRQVTFFLVAAGAKTIRLRNLVSVS